MSKKLQVKDKIESEKEIKVAPFKKDIRKATAHKHNNYLEIIYLLQGRGYHFIIFVMQFSGYSMKTIHCTVHGVHEKAYLIINTCK